MRPTLRAGFALPLKLWRPADPLCVISLTFSLICFALGCAAPVQKAAEAPAQAPELPLEERAAQMLSQAIRFRTVNPPGDEKPLARYLRSVLRAAGIEAHLVKTPRRDSRRGRAALWARLPGRGLKSPIVLLSHLDVVPAEPEDGWRDDPFAGLQRDGEVIGRGAIDAKGVAVVHLLTLVELAKRRERLERDVVLLATPDEESGGLFGAGWLVRERPELVLGAEYLLTEGGGIHVDPAGGPDAWQVAVSEKSPCWLRVETHGRAGHSSVPDPRAAVPRLLEALDRIRHFETPLHVVPEVANMFRALAPLAPPDDRAGFAALAATLASDAGFRRRFLAEPAYAALVRTTVAITVLRGGPRTNVVPAVAAAQIDARLVPGELCADFAGRIDDLVQGTGAEVQTLLAFPAASSPVETSLFRAIESVAHSLDPRSVVVPRVLTGFTDAHWFRDLGITAYGFVPRWQRRGEARGIHGPNERISTENLRRGVETLVAILERLDQE